MTWKIDRVRELDGFTVEWQEPGNYILSRRNVIYGSPDLRAPFGEVATVDAPAWKQAASLFRPFQRLMRFSVTNVIRLASGDLFVAFDKAIGKISGGKYIELKGLHRPCRILRGACAVDSAGDVFFGEYLANKERGPMRIYRYRSGGDSVETVFEFPAGSIRHVHGIYYDPFRNSLVCLTGDNDSECRIFRTADGFRSVEEIGRGDETWRAVSVQFSDMAMYYGTDAEFQGNLIYELSRDGERKSLGEVTGTVFYSKKIGSEYIFTTTAENAPSQLENVAAIWNVDHESRLTEIAKFEKDLWPGTLFQFGTIQLPNFGEPVEELYFSLVGVKGDNRTYRLQRD